VVFDRVTPARDQRVGVEENGRESARVSTLR